MSAATLSSLPTEILDVIIRDSHLPLRALAELARSTPAILANICLSIYLERNAINKPEEACTFLIPQNSADFDVLSALSLAVWVTKTQRLECHFEGRDGDLSAMLAQLARLQELLDRFTFLGNVVLSFNPQDKLYTDPSDDDMANWSDAMGNLLSSVVERGCITLEVNGLRQMCDTYHGMLLFPRKSSAFAQPLSALDSAIKGLARLFSDTPPADSERSQCGDTVLWGPTWDYRRDETKSTTSPKHHSEKILARLSESAKAKASKLTHLTIGSKSMLCPPLLQWTYSALKSFPISTLTIRDVDFVGSTWSILSILIPQAIPSLERLELLHIGTVTHDQIGGFIGEFCKLKHLSVDSVDFPWYTTLSGHGSGTPQQWPLSPCLEELRVQLSWILPTMDFGAHTFPALRTLAVVLGEGLPRIKETSPLLALSRQRKVLHFEVILEIRASNDIIPWMRRTKISDDDQLLEFFQCVSGLVLVVEERLEFEHEPNKEMAREAAEGWFGQFPALREAGIRTGADNLSVEIPRIQKFCNRALPEVSKTLRRFHVNDQILDSRRL